MAKFIIDTDVAIHLRDLVPAVTSKIRALDSFPALSIITRLELENGVYRDAALSSERRALLGIMLEQFATIDFRTAELTAYVRILEGLGYARRKVNDRMIAATALAHDLTLITMNGPDFRDIPDLRLEEWSLSN